jgi:hypothetical protein
MAELRIPIIVENKGKKALGDVDKGVKGLSKSFKKLAGAAGIALGTAAVLNFGKKAAKAFIEDEKAASQLAISVKNLGLAFDTPRIEEFISNLSKASGVADDVLRPSMQKLLQTTGSVAKSTELLTQALDISRGSGVDYETVVNDLTMAYVGQTRGLRKYSLGLSQAELKAMKFSDVQDKLNKQFSGANAAYLDTYAGKMAVFGTAAGEASEIIGKGLIDALMILSGDTTVDELAVSMETLASNTAKAVTELAKLVKGVVNFGTESYGKVDNFADDITDFLDRLTGHEERIAERARAAATAGMGGYPSSALGGTFVDPNAAARKAAEAAAAKRAKELAALQRKTLDTQKKALALQKASKTLNLEAIGIEAGLKGKISETDRISLLLQKAILEGNATLATQLSDQLNEAIKRNEQLRLALLATPKAPNPYEDWKIPADLLAYTAATLGVSAETVIKAPETIGAGMTDATQELIDALIAAAESQRKADAAQAAAEATSSTTNVKVVLDGQELTSIITETQVNDSLSGTFSDINRVAARGSVGVR